MGEGNEGREWASGEVGPMMGPQSTTVRAMALKRLETITPKNLKEKMVFGCL